MWTGDVGCCCSVFHLLQWSLMFCVCADGHQSARQQQQPYGAAGRQSGCPPIKRRLMSHRHTHSWTPPSSHTHTADLYYTHTAGCHRFCFLMPRHSSSWRWCWNENEMTWTLTERIKRDFISTDDVIRLMSRCRDVCVLSSIGSMNVPALLSVSVPKTLKGQFTQKLLIMFTSHSCFRVVGFLDFFCLNPPAAHQELFVLMWKDNFTMLPSQRRLKSHFNRWLHEWVEWWLMMLENDVSFYKVETCLFSPTISPLRILTFVFWSMSVY